MYMKARQALML